MWQYPSQDANDADDADFLFHPVIRVIASENIHWSSRLRHTFVGALAHYYSINLR